MRTPSSRGVGLALAASFAIHALVLGVLEVFPRFQQVQGPRQVLDPVEVTLTDWPAPEPAPRRAEPPAGEDAVTVPGPADHHSPDPASPWPLADVSTPDPRPAARGGGEPGGTDTWTGRDDGQELRSQIWDNNDTYRLPRTRTAAVRQSPEPVPREEAPGIAPQRHARRTPAADATSIHDRDLAGDWDDFDPRYSTHEVPGVAAEPDPGQTGGAVAGGAVHSAGTAGDGGDPRTRAPRAGAVDPHRESPLLARGSAANESHRRGENRDDVDSAQASSERHPQVLELTRPSAGGRVDDGGVRGPVRASGLSAISPHRTGGQGGTPADVARRRGGMPSTRADLQNDYFKRLYARVLGGVRYPEELALELEQGQVVVSFVLNADGSVDNVRISRSSGFEAFDRAVKAAVERSAPFGRVPRSVSHGKAQVFVHAPFEFKNPLIR